MAKRSQLHQQLHRDLLAAKQKRKVYAFGTKLSPDMQIHPPSADDVKKWLVCKRVPADIESMAAVWQGITHLRSTRAYCDYLIEHPQIKPPKYLKDTNMLDPVMLRTHKFSTEKDLDLTYVPSRAAIEHEQTNVLL